MAEHVHYQCQSCERVFCTDDPRWARMTEEDTCPACHVAVVTRLPDAVEDEGAEMPEMVREALGTVANSVDFGNLLISAARVYPYISQDFTDVQPPMAAGAAMTPNDGRRAAAAVEVVFLMADLIVAHVKAKGKRT